MFKLGEPAFDKASGVPGTLTHMQVHSNARWYNFQPAGLNPEDGTPAPRTWIGADRIEAPEQPEPKLPLEAMGTEAEDKITGFKGVVVAIVLHLNGCVHIELQPKGTDPKTGRLRSTWDIDMRMLKGPAFPNLTEEELVASREEHPSPESHSRHTLRQP